MYIGTTPATFSLVRKYYVCTSAIFFFFGGGLVRTQYVCRHLELLGPQTQIRESAGANLNPQNSATEKVLKSLKTISLVKKNYLKL